MSVPVQVDASLYLFIHLTYLLCMMCTCKPFFFYILALLLSYYVYLVYYIHMYGCLLLFPVSLL